MLKVYTPLIEQALNMVHDAFHEMQDKIGIPYFEHCIAVASQMDCEYEIVSALLHDIIEDTETTIEDLRRAGIPRECTDTIACLSKNLEVDCATKGELQYRYVSPHRISYETYMWRIMKHDMARKIKLADMRHNLHPHRLAMIPDHLDRLRITRKYRTYIEQFVDFEIKQTIKKFNLSSEQNY